TENAAKSDVESLARDLALLRAALPAKTELWASIDSLSSTVAASSTPIAPVRPSRSRNAIALETTRFRASADRVLVHDAEAFSPDAFLIQGTVTRGALSTPVDADLEARALDAGRRLRRCCLRDGLVLAVLDQRFERDRDDNLPQKDSCL